MLQMNKVNFGSISVVKPLNNLTQSNLSMEKSYGFKRFNTIKEKKEEQPVKRSRFASALDQDNPLTNSSKKMKSIAEERVRIVGTPQYMAPEMTIGKGLDKPTVDYWALGIILFELLTGCTPFDGDSPEEMFENIRSNKVPWDQLEIGYDEDQVKVNYSLGLILIDLA